MNKPPIDTIVWDLDNVTWDWVYFAAKAYPAMRQTLVRNTRADIKEVTECMRKYYGNAKTLESSWLVQGLEEQELFKGTEAERENLINAVQRTYHACRHKYLHLFKGFPELFEMAIENGVSNVIHTDSPARHATSRIKFFKLDRGFFRQMIAMPDSLPRKVPTKHRKSYDGGRYGLSFPVHLADCEKPNTDLVTPLEMTAEEIGEHAAFVDDNYGKGMGSAARFGALGIYARWGKASREHLDIVREFSGHEIANRNSEQIARTQVFPNVIPADHPLEIPRILGWR